MISDERRENILNNEYIKEEHKEIIMDLFNKSDSISFGKIGPRQEGYICKGKNYPRCTSVLQMDGTKAAALMEWAKREIVEDAKQRLKYELNKVGKLTDSVIDFLLEESFNAPNNQRDSAAAIGTDVHDDIEKDLNGESVKDSEQLRIFRNIWKQEKVELICTEMPIVCNYTHGSEELGFGGKLDILAYKDGEFIIYDNKTSRSVHNSYALQTAAYKAAVEQMCDYKIKVKTAKIIHVPDVSTMKDWQLKQYKKLGNLIECKDLDKAFDHFGLLLEQYYKRNVKYF